MKNELIVKWKEFLSFFATNSSLCKGWEIRNNGLNKVVLDCLLGCDNILLGLYKEL